MVQWSHSVPFMDGVDRLLKWQELRLQLERISAELKVAADLAVSSGFLSPERKDSVGMSDVGLDFWLLGLRDLALEVGDAADLVHMHNVDIDCPFPREDET